MRSLWWSRSKRGAFRSPRMASWKSTSASIGCSNGSLATQPLAPAAPNGLPKRSKLAHEQQTLARAHAPPGLEAGRFSGRDSPVVDSGGRARGSGPSIRADSLSESSFRSGSCRGRARKLARGAARRRAKSDGVLAILRFRQARSFFGRSPRRANADHFKLGIQSAAGSHVPPRYPFASAPSDFPHCDKGSPGNGASGWGPAGGVPDCADGSVARQAADFRPGATGAIDPNSEHRPDRRSQFNPNYRSANRRFRGRPTRTIRIAARGESEVDSGENPRWALIKGKS